MPSKDFQLLLKNNYQQNMIEHKKSLKIPKGYSKSVNQRKTDNTIVKRNRTNDNDLQNNTQENIDRATQTPLKTGSELMFSRRVSCFCSTSDTVNFLQDSLVSPLRSSVFLFRVVNIPSNSLTVLFLQ